MTQFCDAMYDVIVIGAGIIGCSTALHLAKQNKKVVLLEQFPFRHSRGSSSGQSRIFSTISGLDYGAGDALRSESLKRWHNIQRESGVDLLRKRSLATIANTRTKKQIEELYSNALQSKEGTPTWVPVSEFNQKFNTTFPPDSLVFLYDRAGVLMAEKCLTAIQKLFEKAGGILLDEWQVTSVKVGRDGVISVSGSKGEISSKKLIVCAGPWSQQVLRLIGIQAPLRTRKAIVYYWQVEKDSAFTDLCFADLSVPSHAFGTPMIEYPGLIKIATGGVYVSPTDRDRADMSANRKKVFDYVKSRFPFLNQEPAIKESCMYTDSPDDLMILDQHPVHKNIAFVCGFKGTGFKLAPAIGKVLSELVLEGKSSIDVGCFKLDRFKSTLKSRI